MMTKKSRDQALRDYHRNMHRSQLVSLFWSIIVDRKKLGFKLQDLANKLHVDKGQVSRWFSGLPNWEANTVSDVAGALDVDIQVMARDRKTGKIYSASGAPVSASTGATPPPAWSKSPDITASKDGTADNPSAVFEVIV